MTTVSFSGLASGLDTSSLITSLVNVAKAPETQLQSQQADLASKTQIVNNLSSNLGALGDLLGGMSLDTDVQFRTASSSDSHVQVTVSGSANAATHDVRVDQLARAQVVTSKTFATDAAGVAGNGSLTIQTGTGTPATVTWDSTDSLEDVAQKINDANAGVAASVLFDGSTYRIVTSASSTGTSNAPTFTDSGDGLDLSDPTNVKVAAQNAVMEVDGVSVTRPTNTFDDVLPGVTMTAVSAQAAADPDTQVGITVDNSAITDKLNSFVSAYNTVVSALHQQLDYSGSTAGTNTLFGDSTLMQLEGALDGFATGQLGNGQSLATLGLQIDKTGQMSLDTDTLNTALAADPNALSTIFVGQNVSKSFTSLISGYTEAGDGILSQQVQGYSDETTSLQQQIDTIDDNANTLQTQLQDEFNNLETTMSKLNSQSSYISKILA